MTTNEDVFEKDYFGFFGRSEAVITGTVVCSATIAAAAGHMDSIWQLAIAILGTTLIYWLAHVHATAIGHAVANRDRPTAALRYSLYLNAPVVLVSLLPLAILLFAALFDGDIGNAATVALVANIGLLTAYGYIAGRRGGLTTLGSVGSAATGTALGLLIILLKAVTH